MSYSTGFLKDRITILNRKAAKDGRFGLDSDGIEWEAVGCVWASVEWAKGKTSLNAGAIDAYSEVLVRTRWTCDLTMRSRIEYDGMTYQILPDTFHPNRRENTIQFNAKAIINDL